jgi:hypothetical protein
VVLAALLGGLAATPAAAAGPGAAGVLLSTDRDPRGWAREFRQREAYLAWPLGGRDLGGGWRLGAGLQAGGGTVEVNGRGTWLLSLGPLVTLQTPGDRFRLHGGVRPTYWDDRHLGILNVGSYLQFTSHAGIALRLGRGLWVGYRIQHVSNADLDRSNPGLNLNTFEARFEW